MYVYHGGAGAVPNTRTKTLRNTRVKKAKNH